MKRWLTMWMMAAALCGCGYKDFQRLDADVASKWGEVLQQYQNRLDLVPGIVASVKGQANFEREVLTQVIEARSRALLIPFTPALINHPASLQKFQNAQAELTKSLSHLMLVAEQYPQLQANPNFRAQRVTLQSVENQITLTRNRYMQAVQAYNVLARGFPSNFTGMLFGFHAKANFTAPKKVEIPHLPDVAFSLKNTQ